MNFESSFFYFMLPMNFLQVGCSVDLMVLDIKNRPSQSPRNTGNEWQLKETFAFTQAIDHILNIPYFVNLIEQQIGFTMVQLRTSIESTA